MGVGQKDAKQRNRKAKERLVCGAKGLRGPDPPAPRQKSTITIQYVFL